MGTLAGPRIPDRAGVIGFVGPLGESQLVDAAAGNEAQRGFGTMISAPAGRAIDGVGDHRRRPHPGVEVEVRRHRNLLGRSVGFDVILVHVERHVAAPQVDPLQLPDVAVADQLNHLPIPGHRTVLRSELEDPLLVADHVPEDVGETEIQAQRLLAVNVLAGFGRRNGHGHVPVVVGGHDDGVHVGAGQNLAKVGVRLDGAGFAILLIQPGGGCFAAALVGVRDGDDPHVGHRAQEPDVIVGDVAAADLADVDAVARRRGAEQRLGQDLRNREDRADRGGAFQEVAAGTGCGRDGFRDALAG